MKVIMKNITAHFTILLGLSLFYNGIFASEPWTAVTVYTPYNAFKSDHVHLVASTLNQTDSPKCELDPRTDMSYAKEKLSEKQLDIYQEHSMDNAAAAITKLTYSKYSIRISDKTNSIYPEEITIEANMDLTNFLTNFLNSPAPSLRIIATKHAAYFSNEKSFNMREFSIDRKDISYANTGDAAPKPLCNGCLHNKKLSSLGGLVVERTDIPFVNIDDAAPEHLGNSSLDSDQTTKKSEDKIQEQLLSSLRSTNRSNSGSIISKIIPLALLATSIGIIAWKFDTISEYFSDMISKLFSASSAQK